MFGSFVVTFISMKKLLLLLLLLPSIALAQYDFDTRYFTIEADALPDIESLTNFSLEKGPAFSEKLPTFNLMTRTTFWQPVDMVGAIGESRKFISSKVEINPVNAKVYGLNGFSGYADDAASGVDNSVYKEVRGLDLLGDCPPYGICARCAPYRVNRGY